MGKIAVPKTTAENRKMRPVITPEARESRMISLAMDVAEQQLRDGTASSQVITHYLKLGSSLSKLEAEKIKHETALLATKQKSIESTAHLENVYLEAVKAMRGYSGQDNGEEDEEQSN